MSFRLQTSVGIKFSPCAHFPFQVLGIGPSPDSSRKLGNSGHIPGVSFKNYIVTKDDKWSLICRLYLICHAVVWVLMRDLS